LEGVGVVEALGGEVSAELGLGHGKKVAFFPVRGAWSDWAVAPAASVAPVPDGVPDQIAAQMLVNSATASMLLRAGHNGLPPDKLNDVTVIQTGASSAVGKLITLQLLNVGVLPIRLVQSRASALIAYGRCMPPTSRAVAMPLPFCARVSKRAGSPAP
jgi:NADPH:quinone reductase